MTERESERRDRVLAAALATFARYGYRKTSMDDVARAAGISRPGLYFLFDSKPDLFRAAVTRALDDDLAAARQALGDTGRPLRDRLIEAFDAWTGRYVGPMARDVPVLLESSPEVLGGIADDYPRRFAALVTDALAAERPDGRPHDVARTLLSTVRGLKQEAAGRAEFRTGLTVAVELLLRP